LIWKVTGSGSDDNYDIYLRQNPYPGYSDKNGRGIGEIKKALTISRTEKHIM